MPADEAAEAATSNTNNSKTNTNTNTTNVNTSAIIPAQLDPDPHRARLIHLTHIATLQFTILHHLLVWRLFLWPQVLVPLLSSHYFSSSSSSSSSFGIGIGVATLFFVLCNRLAIASAWVYVYRYLSGEPREAGMGGSMWWAVLNGLAAPLVVEVLVGRCYGVRDCGGRGFLGADYCSAGV